MWTTSKNNPEGSGTIEDIIVRARQKYSDVEMQAKYIKIGIDLIRRDHGDEVSTSRIVVSGYEGVLTMFADGGEVIAHWELYENGGIEASGVEKYSPMTKKFQLLFSSSLEFNQPILPRLMSN